MKRPIENNSKMCDNLYDPFDDSGTTIIVEATAKTFAEVAASRGVLENA